MVRHHAIQYDHVDKRRAEERHWTTASSALINRAPPTRKSDHIPLLREFTFGTSPLPLQSHKAEDLVNGGTPSSHSTWSLELGGGTRQVVGAAIGTSAWGTNNLHRLSWAWTLRLCVKLYMSWQNYNAMVERCQSWLTDRHETCDGKMAMERYKRSSLPHENRVSFPLPPHKKLCFRTQPKVTSRKSTTCWWRVVSSILKTTTTGCCNYRLHDRETESTRFCGV
jgi:hypothetical protein